MWRHRRLETCGLPEHDRPRPSGWHLTRFSKRTCGINNTGELRCDSTIFPVSGGAYSSVCGNIKEYQYKGTGIFRAYHNGLVTTINGAYFSGVSLMHGRPRQHIWTFAAGNSEISNNEGSFPCDLVLTLTFHHLWVETILLIRILLMAT